MIIKYNIEINNEVIILHLNKLINGTYKLLPLREEQQDWKKPLSTLIEEIAGMNNLLSDHQDILFPLLCKMEGLSYLEDNFMEYRRVIFDCINLLGQLVLRCQEEKI
jgi:hypothetical protein